MIGGSSHTTLLRLAGGILALLLLIGLALVLPGWSGARQKALVEAARTFSLVAVDTGQYEWSLRDGFPAKGRVLLDQRVIQFERGDLVELHIDPALTTGDKVTEGQVLAEIRSPRDQSRLEQLQGLRVDLEAQVALLRAGARPEEVRQAEREVSVAERTRDGDRALLERTRILAAAGAAAAQELEAAEAVVRVREMEVEVARAAVDVARSSAQPEELDSIDAQIDAVSAEILEVQSRLDASVIRSPIAGVLELGGNAAEVRVYRLDPAYLRIPIPEADRHRVTVGDAVEFTTLSAPGHVFRGTLVDLSEDASNLSGLQVFWASAEIPNPDLVLRSGMTGVTRLEFTRNGHPFLRFWQELVRYGI
jgi:multidrug efflux pump subunit AcrA (membrane-fusion protein)